MDIFIKNKYVLFGLAIFLLSSFFSLGFFFGKNSETKDTKEKSQQNKEIRQSGYKFINPLLECEVENTSAILKSSEIKIKKTIQEEIIEKNPDANVSIYYRDLKNGPAFGINEQDQYSPASLLKVPLMIAYFKYAEHNPDIFKKEIFFQKPLLEFNQQIKPEKSIEIGESYSVEQLIEYMIKYSDNEAANLLFQNIDLKELEVVYTDLGLSMPNVYDLNNSISAKDYASFFRILYNASYLDRDMSEKAIQLLSEVEYDKGITAGTPSDIIVAHKFGEREFLSEDKKVVRQLHDCGIVYHPSRPYLICVMSKGKEFENLSYIVSKISSIIYEEINAQ